MNNRVLMNVLMNFVLMMLFVVLNNWALQGGLEETFVFLAIIYGILVVVMNAVYVAKVAKR